MILGSGLRYNNLIQVEEVYFYHDSMTIEFLEGNILYIRNYAESDFAWILEEVTLKTEQERMSERINGDNFVYTLVLSNNNGSGAG